MARDEIPMGQLPPVNKEQRCVQQDQLEDEEWTQKEDEEWTQQVENWYQSQPTEEEVWREELKQQQLLEHELDLENQEKQSDRENWYACYGVPKEMQQYMEWSLLDMWQKQHPPSDYPLQPPRKDQPPIHVQLNQMQELYEQLMSAHRHVRQLQQQ